MRFAPDIRAAFRQLRKKGIPVKKIAELFDTTRKTVYRWLNRTRHPSREYFNDKPRKPKDSKVTVEVEVSILALRSLGWGTARIQQGLYALPEFIRKAVNCIQGIYLSRETINNILTKHGANGYPHNHKSWKFFRASKTNELWQIDLKGPYAVYGQKYWFLVCIDDYSRYLLIAEQFEHESTTAEITGLLEKLESRPEHMLSDNGIQFREQWKRWCKEHGIEPLFAHPYYPQDKGKVERCIRNLNEEFIYLLRRFPSWLSGKIRDYKNWFNNQRFHRGINNFPVKLYSVSLGT
jgi:IS30 family transposase